VIVPLHELLPHAGVMCLLAAVESFDAQRICCRASSHRDAVNPLRREGRLPVFAGIEYAAQAVAVHGGLLARQAGASATPRGGMIAVLTDVSWTVDFLDDITDDLHASAEKLADLADGLCYRFTLAAAGTVLLQGELIVALQPAGEAA
jgi:predicted hotdog family 3-hydroxylacyl-ACP dehydratase